LSVFYQFTQDMQNERSLKAKDSRLVLYMQKGGSMKRFKSVLYPLLLFFIVSGCSAMAEQVEESEVVAKVNGKEIFSADVDFYIDRLIEQAKSMGQEMTPEIEKNIRSEWIDKMITKELFLEQAVSESVTVTDEEIDDVMGLAQTQGANLPPDELKALIKDDLMISKVIESKIVSKIVITDKESEDLYNVRKGEFKLPEQVSAKHILIKVDASASEEERKKAKEKIESVLKEARAGKEEFSDLAKKYSEGPSGPNGGDLGYFIRGQMVPSFEEAAFSLNKGEISDVVETMFGYHIIKVEDKKESTPIPFADVKEDIEKYLIRQKSSEKIEAWIKELRSNATIEVYE
jgi:peptidyl-prolyl cis-trans isomerase C